MRKPTVYYTSLRDDSDCPLDKVDSLLDAINLNTFIKKDDVVAVKTHFGEEGSVRYIRPTYVRKVVDAVIDAGGKPFVTDTTTLYPGQRFTAVAHLKTAARNGFTGESMNAPIIIADGARGYDGVFTDAGIPASQLGPGRRNEKEAKADLGFLSEVHVARAIAEADKLVVVSHLKLHEFAGFGGAIKNLGMGCVTKVTKAACHRVNRPIYQPKKCKGCFDCVDACEYDCIGKNGKKIVFDRVECKGCLACYFGCESKAWKLPGKITHNLQGGLAESAKGVVNLVGPKNIIYLNMLIDIVEFCDCAPMAGVPITEDLGYLISKDPVAVDTSCIDLIARDIKNKKRGRSGKKFEYEKHLNQLVVAEHLELGRRDYNLKLL